MKRWKNSEFAAENMYSHLSMLVWEDDTVALLARQRTCDSEIAGSSPGWAAFRRNLLQATYACLPLSPSSIIWYQPMGGVSLAGKVTAGLVESNGSLRPGL